AEAGEGLAAAHSVDMVHGDFKPDNVIVTPAGAVKVLDFGLARGFEPQSDGATFDTPSKDIKSVSESLLRSASGSSSMEETEEGSVFGEEHTAYWQRGEGEQERTRAATMIAGTPAYMSPEHFTGGRSSFATDQFAFCVALFEALYGARPFHGETPTELSMNVVDGGLSMPAETPRRVPQFLRRAVVRGLSVDPRQRFSSMQLLVSEVRRRPAKRALKIGSLAASAIIAVSLGMVIQQRMNPSATCSDLVTKIDEVTDIHFVAELVRKSNEGRRGSMAKLGDLVERAVDGIAERWRETAQTSCDDLNIRGSISEEEYEMRVRCLEHSQRRLELYLDRVRENPESAIMGAAEALRSLPDPSLCMYAERSQTGEFGESDARTQALREQLFELQTAYLYGDYNSTEAQIDPFVEKVRAQQNKQLLAHALYLRALVRTWRGDRMTTLSGLWEEASLAADRARDDLLRLQVEVERADSYTHTNSYDTAEQALDRAEAIRVRVAQEIGYADDTIEYQRGFVQMRRGDYREAERILRGVWDRNVDDPDAWEIRREAGTLLGLICRDTGRPLEALEYTQRACEAIEKNMSPFHPDNTSCQLNLASIYASLRRFDEAHAAYDEIISLYTGEREDGKGNLNLAFVYSLKALAFAELQEFERALEFHRKAVLEYDRLGLAETSEGALEYDNMGLTLLLHGKLDESQEMLERSLKVWSASSGPEHADVSYPLNHLGLHALVRGDLADARKKYAQARKLRDAFPQDETDTSLMDFVGAMLIYGIDPERGLELADSAMARLGEDPSGGHLGALRRWRKNPVAPRAGASNWELFSAPKGTP
ncbi:MAG: tetratricopeptide repeat protein, partial [Nannocystaceae bacterium]